MNYDDVFLEWMPHFVVCILETYIEPHWLRLEYPQHLTTGPGGGGGDLVPTMPGYVCPNVKDMGPFSASRELND